MVRMLSDEGMSTRAIAPIVGVKSDQTVRADLDASQVRDRHAPVPHFVNTTTGEVYEVQTLTPM